MAFVMVRKIALWSVIFFLLFVFSLAASNPPVSGNALATIKLPVPANPDERKYLGVSGKLFFRIPQVKADMIVIEIFSLYCPQCQTAAPEVNALYRMIEEVSDLENRIKMIGIGAGNSVLEVNAFREKHRVPFPLFPDQDFTIHKLLGEVRTPYFMIVKFDKNRASQVIYAKEGAFGEAENFLQQIMEAARLK
jgi:peroxiredoxin